MKTKTKTKTKQSLIGRKAKFVYPNYGTPCSFFEHKNHSGQIVTIINQYSSKHVDPEVGKMFKIKAKDGWTGDAFRDELTIKRLTPST